VRKRWASISLRSLQVQILLWTILPLTILLIALSLTGIRSHQHSMRLLVAERDAGLARLLADDIAMALARYTTSLQVLAASEALRHGDSQTIKIALTQASHQMDGMALLTVDTTGRVLTGPPVLPTWTDEAVRHLLTAPKTMDGPAITTMADQRTLVWSIPVGQESPTSSPQGWLLAGLPLDALPLARLREASHLSQVGTIVLVDREKRILYANGPLVSGETLDDGPGVAPALAGEQGVLFVPTPQGELVVAYTPVAGVGWALILREPWESLAAPLLRFDRVMPFVLLTAAVVSLLTLFFGLRYVVRPLQKLEAQARQIGLGDFEAVAEPVGGVKEIEELRRTLDQMAHQVRRYQDALEAYLGAMTRAQEEERARLARELHDETVQTLIALNQRVQMVQRTLEQDPTHAAQRLAELRTMLSEAVEEVRRFSRALRPLYLEELGLVPALEMLAREAGAFFRYSGPLRRLTAEQELALYRIAQEALSNVQRHANASHAEIELAFAQDKVLLRVWDDGRGFAVPDRLTDLTRNGHFGLMGMYERAQLIGGRLTITSTPGHGTTVEVQLSL